MTKRLRKIRVCRFHNDPQVYTVGYLTKKQIVRIFGRRPEFFDTVFISLEELRDTPHVSNVKVAPMQLDMFV